MSDSKEILHESPEEQLLFEMILQDDECLMSSKFEGVSLSDYDTIVSGLNRVIEAFQEQEVYTFLNDNYDEYVFSPNEKNLALANYLETIASKLRKAVTDV